MRSKKAQSEFRTKSLKRKLTAQDKQQQNFDAQTERIISKFKRK